MLSCVKGLDKLNMPALDAQLPKIPKQQQQQELGKRCSKESQTVSHKKGSTSKNSVLNQTVFTDAREATMLSEVSNATTNKTNANATMPSSNITSNNITNSTQQLADTPTKDGTSKHVSNKDGEEKIEAEIPAKKPRGKKPRIIFHPEDECRRSSKPSDDDDIVDSNGGIVDNDVTDVKESDEIASSSNEEETTSSSKEEETDKFSKENEEAVSTSTPSKSANLLSTGEQLSGSNAADSQYQLADTYQSSEFRPYNPLSHIVEEKLFPRPFGPANFFDYPSWPDKTECLDVVENLSSWVKSSRMDIDMAKRGHE